jgi:hypothetical protein
LAYQSPRRLVGEGGSTIASAPKCERSLRVQRIVSTSQTFLVEPSCPTAGQPTQP